MIDPDLLFAAEPRERELARNLFAVARDLPVISPHGHVDPWLLAEDRPFGDPATLLIKPDHYVTRLLHSQGVPPHLLGCARVDGGLTETDGRTVWRTLARHWSIFRGTPSRLWLELTLSEVFEVDVPLSEATADDIYDHLAQCLASERFRPRALFERFNIEVLATTEAPLDDLAAHAKLATQGWGKRVITTFRPDDIADPEWPGWSERLDRLGELTGEDTTTYAGYLAAVQARRDFFRAAGARSTDHGHATARTLWLDPGQVAQLFQRMRRTASAGTAVDADDAELFRAHMLVEFARMSVDDGLVMQLHPGSVRNHNKHLYETYGRDSGGDIPQATEFTHALRPLLDRFGNDPRLRLVVYTLDETAYTRELAPIAGGYPAVYLGPPWWFLDTPDAMRRFREGVTDTIGFANTTGFVDDTRAFCSIPVRHQVARRVDAAHLARLVTRGRLRADEATETIADLAYHLPKRVYRLDQ